MTKILVTGAFGLLGCSLVPYLKASGYEVFRQSRSERGDVVVDLTDCNSVNMILDKIRPDVIINLAALTSVDECERRPQKAYLSNVRAVENLVSWIKCNKCHLIHISTDQVYDGRGPHDEKKITLRNYYGFSKYAGELAAACVPSTILRTNFFGKSRCAERVSISDWLIGALLEGEPIKVFDDVRFSPLSISSLVKLIGVVIEKRKTGVYNLGSKNGMSKADFAFELARVLALPINSMQRGTSDAVKLDAYRPKDMCMDIAAFEKAFSISLPTFNEEIILVGDATYECA